MNRVILIGNGFDLAHGLKTSYNDFIDDFWNKKTDIFKRTIRNRSMGVIQNNFLVKIPSGYKYNDNDIYADIADFGYFFQVEGITQGSSGYDEFYFVIAQFRINKHSNNLHFNNLFLERITTKKQLKYWVDIEDEYYLALNECLQGNYDGGIERLNSEFLMIKTSLESYLKEQMVNKIDKLTQIEQNINSSISLENILKKPKISKLFETLYLNFNYKDTEKLYIQNNNSDKVIHIHGELDNPKNHIIFGYGDDIDEKYKFIEQQNDNRYLENIKSIKYLETRNYQEMLKFIDTDEYIIYIMGLSCGNSDRTLLNTLFEHKNCISIKVFYHQREDGTDDYSDVIRNISRNFTDKSLFRKIVVDKTLCVPLS
jgi:hypothetical protein